MGIAPGAGGAPIERASKPAIVGWVLVDWAVQPFHTLIVTFLFGPYFTIAVAGDPVQGQAWWGYAAAIAGVVIAIGGPILGAIADRGRRKSIIAMCSVVLAAAATALWLARPGADPATIVAVLLAFIVATAAAEYIAVCTNSMMPALVPASELGRLSGTSWAIAYVGGLASLAFMAGLVVSAPGSAKTLMGLDPIFTLDTAQRQGDRLTGPFTALWLLVFVIPFFVFTPDVARGHAAQPAERFSLSQPLQDLWGTLMQLPQMPSMLYFMLARALYADGLSAMFVFGGIYGASVFGWQLAELGIFGIVLIVGGILGAAVGGFLDDKVGPKRVITVGLVMLMAGAIGILSVTRSSVLFSIPVTPKAAGSGVFSSVGEQVFLGFASIIAFFAAPVQAASRSLLARIAPPDRMAQFFGLFAFSGKVTAFAAPLLIALATQVSGSQRVGIASVLIFFVAGLWLIAPVKERPD